MAVVVPTSVTIGAGVTKYTWASLANGDTGTPLAMPASADMTVQLLGTFGVGGSCRIEGSNDGGTTYATLDEADGNALNLTAAAIELVRENPELIRPNITAGDGATALTVILVAKRTT